MNKVDFVFEYEVKARELDSLCLIAAYLRSKGYSVAFINSWESIYHKPPAYHAKVAVISACYNDATYDFFAGHIASFQKVVNLQWEEILCNCFYDTSPMTESFYNGISMTVRHLCWGEREKHWLIDRYGIESDYLFVKGYVPLDFYRDELKSLMIPRDTLFLKYSLDTRKKTLLFVSSLSYVGLPKEQAEGFADELIHGSAEACYRTQPILLEWFMRFASLHPDIQIVYRYHPTEKDNPAIYSLAEKFPNFFAISEMPIRYWLAACDSLYNWLSTSMIEMYYSGKDTYLLRPVEIEKFVDMPIFDHCQVITTYEDFEQSALQKQEAFPIPVDELQKWYSVTDVPAYRRIGDWLIDTLHDASYTCRPSNINIHKKYPWREVKKQIKESKAYQRISTFCIDHMGRNAFTEKLIKTRDGIIKENIYRHSVADEKGYIHSRYMLNSVTSAELNEKLDQYEALMKQVDKDHSSYDD